MNEITKSKGKKPLGRTKETESRITTLVERYSNGATKDELKEFAMKEYNILSPTFLVYWRWLQDEYALQIGNKEERIQEHLNDLDQLYRDAVRDKKTNHALRIKTRIMELEGTYVPHQRSLFSSFDFDSIELKIMGCNQLSKADNNQSRISEPIEVKSSADVSSADNSNDSDCVDGDA